MAICKLPSCSKNAIPGKSFCSATHKGQYSAFCQHKKITAVLTPTEVKPPKVLKPVKPTSPKSVVSPKRLKNPRPKSTHNDNRKLMYRIDLVKLATPLWADKNKIDLIYKERKQLSTNGIVYHVDHIIPLNHPLVCGLHVENNLRIILKEDNEKKNNNFVIE